MRDDSLFLWLNCRVMGHVFVFRESIIDTHGHVREYQLHCPHCGEDGGTSIAP